MASFLTKHRNKRTKIRCDRQSCGWLHANARNGDDRPRLLSAHIECEHVTAAGRTDAEKSGTINRNLIITIKLHQLRRLPQAIEAPRVNRNAAVTAITKTKKLEIIGWKLEADCLAQRGQNRLRSWWCRRPSRCIGSHKFWNAHGANDT